MSKPITEIAARAYARLQRLREQSRVNLPQMIANRGTTTFSLHEEPAPAQATNRIQVMVYPQDPFIGEAEIRHMNVEDIRPGLVNSRVEIEDTSGVKVQPDQDGNYLFAPGTREFDQVNAFYYTTLTLRMYERYARRSLPWAFPEPRLLVNPHVGNEANAFYNEQKRLLGFHTFTPNIGDPIVSTAQSADIVSHEAGHAVLDGLRDLYNESFGLGTSAFHESFGDMTAVLVALHDDSLLRRVLAWTNGDLRLTNFISVMAEQLTQTLLRDRADTLGHTIYLRNALNTLGGKEFDDMEYAPSNPNFTLGRQPHNYSRLFTGAFYEALVGIYDHLRAESPTPHIALSRARDIMGRLLVTAVECGPVGEFDFLDMACAFLSADQLLHDGHYAEILIKVFVLRGIGVYSDFAKHRAALQNLPEIYLPESLNTALASALFLEDKLIPALKLPKDADLVPLATYRNAEGYAFMTYFSTRLIMLEGEEFKEYKGAGLDAFGGLTLAFSPQNRLVSMIYRPVTDEDVRQLRMMIKDLIREGLIVNLTKVAAFFPDDIPDAVLLPNHEEQGKLVKYPALVDWLDDIVNFVEYLQTVTQ